MSIETLRAYESETRAVTSAASAAQGAGVDVFVPRERHVQAAAALFDAWRT